MFYESLKHKDWSLTFQSMFFCIIYVGAWRAWYSVLSWNFLVVWWFPFPGFASSGRTLIKKLSILLFPSCQEVDSWHSTFPFEMSNVKAHFWMLVPMSDSDMLIPKTASANTVFTDRYKKIQNNVLKFYKRLTFRAQGRDQHRLA